jgi:iron(II)-dependent oxidoreductase
MTSAVGIFAAGESPSGALDTVGNVWEWSLSNFMKSNININNTDERVLRGGSWNYDYVFRLRVDFRYGNAPEIRNDYVGCRLARS